MYSESEQELQRDVLNKELTSSYEHLALKSAFSSQQIERPIEIEMLKLASETRSDTIPFYDSEQKKMDERFTDFKNLNTRDTFFGNLENDIEFVLHDLNGHSSEVLKYLALRKIKKMNWKENRVEWVPKGLRLQEFQYYAIHYKDLHLGLTRSRKGWFAELMQSYIASVKSNLNPLLDKNRSALSAEQHSTGIRGWFARLGGVAK